HEPKHWMMVPMLALAILSIVGGFLHLSEWFKNPLDHEVSWNSYVVILSSGFSIGGICFGIFIYQFRPELADFFKNRLSVIYETLKRGFFVDEFYNWFLEHVQTPFSELCSQFEHRIIVEKMVNGTARLTQSAGNAVR